MFNWFRKKKKETPQNAVIPAEDRGLTVSCTALSADLKIDDKQLIPIKDQRIIGRVVSLSPEVGKLISTTKTAKDAAQSVKSVGDIYRAVLSHGEQLFDSKTMKGAKRGGYLDANNQMHQANLVRVNGEVEGAMQSVANNQMVTSAFNVASMIVGQYYMTQINGDLDKISEGVNRIEQFQESEYVSKITALIKEIKKLDAFQVSSLVDEDKRKEKVRLLTDMEKEGAQLLDQATVSINNLIGKETADFKAYEETTQQIEKWREYQKILLEVLYQISLLMQVFSAGTQSNEEVFFIFNQCADECKVTCERLRDFHVEQHAKHKIDISSNQISNGWLLEGVASVVGIFDEGAKEKIRLRKLSKKTAETIAIQMLPFEDCREREILTFDGDVELIIKEGEVYYLPNEKSSK